MADRVDVPWSIDDFRRQGERVVQLLADFVESARSGKGRVMHLRPVGEFAASLDLRRWIAEGGMADADLDAFLRRFLDGATRVHHPGFVGHQMAVPHYASALADLVAGTINNGMSVYDMGATAATCEVVVVDWLLGKVGWPATGYGETRDEGDDRPRGGGVLTHGGTLANLTGLLAARAAIAPDAWSVGIPGDLVLIAPESAHYAVSRAASVMGMGTRAVVPAPTDDRGRIRPDRLGALCEHVAGAGKRILAVVANACATATGLYDDLEAIGSFCNEQGIWLHVDGAHGASALLSERDRGLLRGVHRADSLVWDAHKLLQTSALCAAALFRDGRCLDQAFPHVASYVSDGMPVDGHDVIEHQFECTKAPIGLKIVMTLAMVGEAGAAAHVERVADTARRFARLIDAREGFEVLCEPESNIVLFRADGDDALQGRLRRALIKAGDFHLTQADAAGRRWLRVTVMNPRTADADIDRLLDAILALADVDQGP